MAGAGPQVLPNPLRTAEETQMPDSISISPVLSAVAAAVGIGCLGLMWMGILLSVHQHFYFEFCGSRSIRIHWSYVGATSAQWVNYPSMVSPMGCASRVFR